MRGSCPGENARIPFVLTLNKFYITPKETRNGSLAKRHQYINNKSMLLDVGSM